MSLFLWFVSAGLVWIEIHGRSVYGPSVLAWLTAALCAVAGVVALFTIDLPLLASL